MMSKDESEPVVGDRISVTVYGNVDYIDKNFIALEIAGCGVLELDLPDSATHVKILSRKQVKVGDEISDAETLSRLRSGSIVWAGHGYLPAYCVTTNEWLYSGDNIRYSSETVLWSGRSVTVLALGKGLGHSV